MFSPIILKEVVQLLFNYRYCWINSNNPLISKATNNINFYRHFTMVTKNTITKIGTHDGTFHCDEALSCFMLKQLPQYEQAEIIRSRQADCLDGCDIVVDVGSVYDHQIKRYDHHQKSFHLTLKDLFPKKYSFGKVKLSSAGLIFCHYGHEIIARRLGFNKDDQKTDKIFDMVYENFIQEIDAIDNGINMFDSEPLYQINTNLSKRVGRLKPHWNECETDEILYQRFLKAIQLTGSEFYDCIDYYGKIWLPAREIVMEAFEKRFEHDQTGRIVVMKTSVPWIEHLFQIEREHGDAQIAFCIFPDKNNWRVRAMPVAEKSFELRNPLHEDWRGLPSEQIDRISSIDGCIFVHSTGFIGGNRTLDGAIEMARKSLKQKRPPSE